MVLVPRREAGWRRRTLGASGSLEEGFRPTAPMLLQRMRMVQAQALGRRPSWEELEALSVLKVHSLGRFLGRLAPMAPEALHRLDVTAAIACRAHMGAPATVMRQSLYAPFRMGGLELTSAVVVTPGSMTSLLMAWHMTECESSQASR